jgi:dipicolinate synthase subunit A
LSEALNQVDWASRRLALIGGDERDPEIARLAAETGASVKAFGIPWPEEEIPGVERVDSSSAAVDDADYIFLPIPLGVGSVIYAPHADEPIVVDEELLSMAAPDAYLICGRVTSEI